MAAKKSKTKIAALDLSAVIAATAAGSFVYTSPEAHASALAEGLVEVNPSMTNEAGELATRATEKGIASMSQNQSSTPAAAPAASKPQFAIDDGIALSPVVGRGRGGETYPFDKLAVGQSFFVPNSADKPNVAKSLASTVSSATRRYATEVAGETVVNRKGKTVPKLTETRKFVLRAVDGGARIWRTQ
jgi:hypothetical protein